MIACITDTELSFGGYIVPVLRRASERSLQRMAERILPTDGERSPQERETRQLALAALQQTWRELSRPLGGKPWTSRDELYER